MIKIIISGTSDGFYPRYASDGVLDDGISNHLLDRRHLITKDADRLNKEGFSFQPLTNGILFHKIIPLFDAFGRDGFMMASLFLPEGEMLDGKEIKEALDAIMREYKMHTVGGIANVELDWSFVKRKADELNEKVRQMIWKKHPMSCDSSRTALIRGADNRVAEYFQYPNPLRPDCAGYGQVFLTESLLDPAMVSENGEQGYKVIDVDIDNPVYEIIYNNPNGYSISGLKQSVERKELMDAVGSYFCGTINQSGYRPKEVFIPADKKTSLDGMTLLIELPILVPKQASVLLTVKDPKTGIEISLEGCTVSWKSDQYYDTQWELRMHTGSSFCFDKEECDRKWIVKVACDQYEEGETQVDINDGDMNKPVEVDLRYNPEWTIVVSSPETYLNVSERVRQDRKESAKERKIAELKKMGLDVRLMEDDKNRVVTLLAEYPEWTIKILTPSNNLGEYKVRSNELEKKIEGLKKDYGVKGLIWKKREDSEGTKSVNLLFDKKPMTQPEVEQPTSRRENTFKDPSRNGIVTEPELPKEPEKKKWVLQLDEKSKKYSIFKNCEKKAELVMEAEQALDRLNSSLESFSNFYRNPGRDAKTVDFVKGQIGLVIEELPKGTNANLKNARKHFDNVCSKLKNSKIGDSSTVENLINCADDAIKAYDACLKIPSAIVKPQNVVYDYESHRLIVECEQQPDGKSKPKFGEDHYSYSFKEKRLDWFDNGDFYAVKKEHTVVRKLRGLYKFLWFVLSVLIICGAGAAWYFGLRESPENDNDRDEIEKLTTNLEVAIDSLSHYKTCYCGDSLYIRFCWLPNFYYSFKKKIETNTDSIEIVKLDSIFAVFNNLYESQKDYKNKDAEIYAKLEFLKDSIKFWVGKQKTFEMLKEGTNFEDKIACMSNSHKKDVRKWYYERLQEKPEPTGTPHQGIEQHQQVINGPQTLFKASTYNNVTNGYSGYNFVFNRNCNYCIPLKDSIISAVRTKNISELDYNSYYNQAKGESSDKGKVKKLKALLWDENTRNVSMQPTTEQPKVSQNDPPSPIVVEQLQNPIIIEKASVLFDELIYKNVSGSRTDFDKKCSLSSQIRKRYSDRINNIIDAVHNKGISEQDYNNIYIDAQLKEKGPDKITALEQGLLDFKKK